MKPMTAELRSKIQLYIKNGIDISDLIEGVEIQNEDFSYAIIKYFNRIKDDISGIRLSKAIIGEEGKITNVSGSKIRNAFFDDVKFLGSVFMRRCDCRGTDFGGAQLQNVQYQGTDFRLCKFCEAAIRIGTSYSAGSKFSPDLFKDLGIMWNLDVKQKE